MFTPKAEPVAVAFSDTKVKTVSSLFNVVLAYVKLSSSIKTSPSGNASLTPVLPDWLYFIKIVISSTPSSGGKIKFFFLAYGKSSQISA